MYGDGISLWTGYQEILGRRDFLICRDRIQLLPSQSLTAMSISFDNFSPQPMYFTPNAMDEKRKFEAAN
jgi:hypothetical protein